MTNDHSPVGEIEDAGELSEEEAMAHPRRNEVFRDVGSCPRSADEREFVEVRQCDLPGDAAMLLCSDGLSDHLTSRRIREIAERYAGERGADGAATWWTRPTRRAAGTTSPWCSSRGRRFAAGAARRVRAWASRASARGRGVWRGTAGVSGLRTAARHAAVGGSADSRMNGMNAPTRIGRYEIIRRLGKSMTDVYLAMDTVENRKVALKLIPEGDDRARS